MKRYVIAGFIILTAGIVVYSSVGSRLLAFIQGRTGVEMPSLPNEPSSGTMRPFRSKAELIAAMAAARKQRGRRDGGTANSSTDTAATAAAPSAQPKEVSKAEKDDGITNNQHVGVDEGGIVKTHGEHLVILRRGRLFTVKVGSRSLDPTSSVDAYPPGVDPSNDWYDEMLVSGNTVVVIGYSYGRGGTEINLFDINGRGGLAYRSSYHLRSNDYYSSRNYASRLIGNKLIFYTPQYLGYGTDPTDQFPAIRKWRKNAVDTEFKPVVGATEIYRAERAPESSSLTTLHTVTACDLSAREMTCKGTGVLGDPGRVFYVSAGNVYVWVGASSPGNSRPAESMLFKMPLDGSAPSAVAAAGAPVDQFSFLEDDTQRLNVLIRSENQGEQMWGSEFAAGDIALLQVNADDFGDGSSRLSSDHYFDLPNMPGYTFQNRFVGDHLLYGTGNGWGQKSDKSDSGLVAVNWKNRRVSELSLDHTVDRIEQMGNAAVVVGSRGPDLYFSPVELSAEPNVKRSFIRRNASQGELRSHGFFYRGETDRTGILGLPITRPGRAGYKHLTEGSAAILFLSNRDLALAEVGELASRNSAENDRCKASCVDWYGNARPIFLKGRLFALLGYEIVEGRVAENGIREVRRINYSPRPLSWWDRTDQSEE